jgi:putative PIN family toxin of toxin-antitoxin system
MLAVVDTKVWVSAFLTPRGTAAKLFDALKRGSLVPAYSDVIESEYREVLSRAKLAIEPELVTEFLERLQEIGRRIDSVPPVAVTLPDPDDAPFIALARHLGCPVVTGNTRHFPPEAGVEALTPAEFLARLMQPDP